MLGVAGCLGPCATCKDSYLCALGGPVHFNTQVVAILLPVELAVHNVEQIANSDLIPGWELHESHPCWDVFVFRNPEGNDIITWRPGEVPEGEKKAVKRKVNYMGLVSHAGIRRLTSVSAIFNSY